MQDYFFVNILFVFCTISFYLSIKKGSNNMLPHQSIELPPPPELPPPTKFPPDPQPPRPPLNANIKNKFY